jgi:hypothetical protein
MTTCRGRGQTPNWSDRWSSAVGKHVIIFSHAEAPANQLSVRSFNHVPYVSTQMTRVPGVHTLPEVMRARAEITI